MESNIITLVLDGKFDAEGKRVDVSAPRRVVNIDLDVAEERGNVQSFFSEELGGDLYLGFGNAENGWWRIVEAFENVEPTVELLDGQFPFAFRIEEKDLVRIIEEKEESK